MELEIKRIAKQNGYTIGRLYVNGELIGSANSGNLSGVNTTAYIGKDQIDMNLLKNNLIMT